MVAAGYALSCSEGMSGGHGASMAAMAVAPSERERQRERVPEGVRASGREARRVLWCSTTSSKAQGRVAAGQAMVGRELLHGDHVGVPSNRWQAPEWARWTSDWAKSGPI